jgi:flagellar biosynthesis protein FlhB
VQFVKSTGLNRIFYEIIDLKRENRVKIIVRQKSLANKLFRLYNYYRIKLEQEYDLISDVTTKIINKNNILDKSNKKK